MHYDMEDLIEQANEIQESLGRSYAVPDEIDEADLEAGESLHKSMLVEFLNGLLCDRTRCLAVRGGRGRDVLFGGSQRCPRLRRRGTCRSASTLEGSSENYGVISPGIMIISQLCTFMTQYLFRHPSLILTSRPVLHARTIVFEGHCNSDYPHHP